MPTTRTFNYTGANQTLTVPAGVTSLSVTLNGAGGGTGAGGAGDRLTGLLAVTPGQVINLTVPGAGGDGATGVGGVGGYPNGGGGASQPLGIGGGGGGGSADIRTGGTAVANRVAIAGGGGGASAGNMAGGSGGGTAGTAGTSGPAGGGGGGGTQTAGGAGGAAGSGGTVGGTGGTSAGGGIGGQGGNVTSNLATARGGGAGGGGYFGGGGGGGHNGAGNGGGGGGGSGFAGGLTSAVHTVGGGAAARTNGSIVVTYNQPPSAPALTAPVSGNYLDPSVSTTFGWTFADPDVGDTQSLADLRYRVVGAALWTTVAGAVTTVPSFVVAGGTFVAGNQYEWQVQTYDSQGTASGWSGSSFFNAANPPAAPTITAPLSQVTANPATVTWTTPGAQVAYQARYVGDDGAGNAVTSVVYSDTGQVNSATQSVALGLGTAGQGGTLHVQVRHQQNPGLWSAWADAGLESVNAGQPGVPTLAFSSSAADGSITVAITNPTVPSPTVVQDLFRTDVGQVPLRVDASALTAVPPTADSLQPLVLSGQPLKVQAGSLAMSLVGSGAQRSDVQFVLGKRVNRMRAEFLFESAAWTTDGGMLGLLALAAPYSGGTVPDSHCYLTVTRTSWALAFVSSGTLTSLLSGTYAALPLDTQLMVEVAMDPYTNRFTVWLPDGSVKTITSALVANLTGVAVDALLSVNAANTDRRPRLLSLWASDNADFGETRIAKSLPPNSSFTDFFPRSGQPYRYRVQASAFFGGTASSA